MSQIKIVNPNATLKGNINVTGKKISELFSLDRAQSRFFTVTVDALRLSNVYVGAKGDIEALPVKSISYTITGIDTMSLSIGLFRDIPIPLGKKLPRITLTLIDDRIDQIETDIRDWCESMMQSGTGVVSYLDQMITSLVYNSYDTCGQLNFSYQASVMLTDDIILNRDTETNDLKSIEISLVVLKDDLVIDNAENDLPIPTPIPIPTAPKPPTILPNSNNNNNNNNFIPKPVEIKSNNNPISTQKNIKQPQPIFGI